MAKTDWDSAAKLFAMENERSGISVQDWCERNGLNYQSARRYLKTRAKSSTKSKTSRTAAQSSTKKPKKNAQTAQKSLRKSNAQNNSAQIKECVNAQIEPEFDDDVELGEPDNPEYNGRDENGKFAKGNPGNQNPSYSFPEGHQINRTHGGYAKLLPVEDLEIGDESEIIGLIAERRMFRARLASALRTVTELESELAAEGGRDDPERVAATLRLIRSANEAIDRAAARIESITKTLSRIRIDDINGPRLRADHKRIEASEAKLRAETDKLGRKSTAESVTFQLDW